MSGDQQTREYAGRVKYTEAQSRRYQNRKPAKHRSEIALIDRAFVLIPVGSSVLDAPCGGGRVLLHLAANGYSVRGADLSEAMIGIARDNVARAGIEADIDHQDLECLTYADRQFDATISFRLFHHFPNARIRQRVVSELCRVSAGHVALSYFSPVSFTSLKRKLLGTEPDRYATSLREVSGYFEHEGFRLVRDFAQVPLLRTLHLAVFERADRR